MSFPDLTGESREKRWIIRSLPKKRRASKPDNEDKKNRAHYNYEETMGRPFQGKNLEDC